LSLLLKLNPRVSKLSLYDIRLAPGKIASIAYNTL
jgi:malate dehydrogenase